MTLNAWKKLKIISIYTKAKPSILHHHTSITKRGVELCAYSPRHRLRSEVFDNHSIVLLLTGQWQSLVRYEDELLIHTDVFFSSSSHFMILFTASLAHFSFLWILLYYPISQVAISVVSIVTHLQDHLQTYEL